VIEHLPEPTKALDRLIAALNLGGGLVLAFPNLWSLKGLVTKFTPSSFTLSSTELWLAISAATTSGTSSLLSFAPALPRVDFVRGLSSTESKWSTTRYTKVRCNQIYASETGCSTWVSELFGVNFKSLDPGQAGFGPVRLHPSASPACRPLSARSASDSDCDAHFARARETCVALCWS
jgi:hypothetical protein